MKQIEIKTDLLLGFFIGSLILANFLGPKITSILGIRISVGILFVPLLFLITDIVSEVHGKKKAQSFVYIAISVLLFMFGMTYLCIHIYPHENWGMQVEYAKVFGNSLRMIFASMVAFGISQLHDVWVFDLLKKKTEGKYLWLRNNVSTMISQLLDTTIFMFLAFYHLTPKFTVPFIISLIIPYWLFKIVFALLDTPLCYLGVKWLKR